MIQSDLKKQKNKPKARVFDLALWGAHHISISLLADVDGGVSDSGQPLYSAPGSGEGGGGELFTPYSPPKTQTTSCPMTDAPSHSPDLRGKPQASWTQPETPHSYHTTTTNGRHPPAPDLSPKTLP